MIDKIIQVINANNIAIFGLCIALILSIVFDEKDTALMLGGAIGGYISKHN